MDIIPQQIHCTTTSRGNAPAVFRTFQLLQSYDLESMYLDVSLTLVHEGFCALVPRHDEVEGSLQNREIYLSTQ